MAKQYLSPTLIYSFCWPFFHHCEWPDLDHLGLEQTAYVPQQCKDGVWYIRELQLRRRVTNIRSHSSLLFPIPHSTRDSKFGGSRRWHCWVASKNSIQHLMKQNRPKRRRPHREYNHEETCPLQKFSNWWQNLFFSFKLTKDLDRWGFIFDSW